MGRSQGEVYVMITFGLIVNLQSLSLYENESISLNSINLAKSILGMFAESSLGEELVDISFSS